jgi:hypothetical protein
MTTILKNVNSTVSPGYGAIPTITYTTNTTAGQFLTSGSNGTSWTNPSTQFNNSNGKPIMTMPNGTDEIVLKKMQL